MLQKRKTIELPLVLILSFILTLGGIVAGVLNAKLEAKADKDTVIEMQKDIREIRNHLLGPKP